MWIAGVYFSNGAACSQPWCTLRRRQGIGSPSRRPAPPLFLSPSSLRIIRPRAYHVEGIDTTVSPSTPARPILVHAIPDQDRLWISDTLSPLSRICPAHSQFPAGYMGSLWGHRTQRPPRLGVVRLGDLLHLDRVVDDEVHELVEALRRAISIRSCGGGG